MDEVSTIGDQPQSYPITPFFELSSDLLCITGFDGYFKRINPALCQLLGYSVEELCSRPVNSFVHPEDQPVTATHRDNLREGKPLRNFENRYLTKSGAIVWLSWTSISLLEKKLIYAIAKNITQKKTDEAERNRLLSELTQTNQHLKQLTYTTSHDLRTPVNNLLAIFNLLDTSAVHDEETLEFLHLLEQASHNLKDTLDHYLDGLNEDKILQIETRNLNLEEVLGSVSRSIDSFLANANVSFQLNFEAFNSIRFNETYLISIFQNLITNSVKYAHPDRSPVISITTRVKNGKKQLLFSDNGQGFDTTKTRGKIFGLRQKFHDHTDSKGIGLYLVYNHITNLGGTITVNSIVNKGTTFTITFSEGI